VTAVSSPALVAVAHGSRDPRSAATIRELVAKTGAHVSFLDLSEPLVTDVLRSLHAEGHQEIIVVPLLLGSAYHARFDLPALVHDVTRELPRLRVSVSGVLGADPALESVALQRLRETGAELEDPELGVVVAAVGSSQASANAAVAQLARRWRKREGFLTGPAFASATRPDIPAAIAKLRAQGARRIAVASWFLAPGLLPDRITALAREADPDVLIAAPLGADDRVAALILRRYSETLAEALRSA
jgi:sirohydrochlorin ferrochelatase